MSVQIEITDYGWQAALDGLQALDGLTLSEGILESAGAVGGVTVAQYATWNEFGTTNIPARPWMRAYWDTQGGRVLNWLQPLLDQHKQPKDALRAWGELVIADHKAFVVRTAWPPNAKATVAAKGSSKPLVDTGRMLQSISWKFE